METKYPENRGEVPDPASLIGSLRGRIRVRGDIMATGVRWDADDQP